MNNLICKRCTDRVSIDVTDGITLVGSFGIGNNGIVFSQGNILIHATQIKPKFFCHNCGEISIENLQAFCPGTRKVIELNDAVIPQTSGGVYSTEYAKKRFKEKLIPLTDVLKKAVNIRR